MWSEWAREWIGLLFLVAGPIPLAWTLAALYCNPREQGVAHTWLGLITLWLGLQTALGLLIGAFHLFHFWGLLAAQGLLFVIGAAAWRASGAGAAGKAILIKTGQFQWPAPLVTLPLAGLAAFMASILILAPTTCYDTLMYHYPTMATWLSTNSLEMFDQWFYISRYPFGWGLLGALFMAGTSGDGLALAGNLIILPYFLLALYLLCRRFGASRDKAALAAAFAAACPIVLQTLHGINADVPLAAFFTAMLYFSLNYQEERRLADIGFFLLAGALLCGVKMSGPVYAIVAGTPFLLLELGRLMRRQPILPSAEQWREQGLWLAGCVAGLFFVGGFWYFRNWIQVGNPLGFVDVSIGGTVIFPAGDRVEPMVQDVRRGNLLNIFEPANLEHWRIVGTEVARFYGLPLLFLVLGALALPYRVLAPLETRRASHALILLFLIPVTLYLYVSSPFTGDNGSNNWRLTPWMGWQLRYGFPLLAVLACAASISPLFPERLWLKIMALLSMGIGGVAATIHLSAYKRLGAGPLSEQFTHLTQTLAEQTIPNMGAVAGCTAALLILGFLTKSWLARSGAALDRDPSAEPATRAGARVNPWHVQGLALACAALLLPSLAGIPHARAKDALYGGVARFVDAHVGPGEVVAYARSHRAYWLFNREYSNAIAFVRAESNDPAQWVRQLREAGASYVAIGPVPGRALPRELEWLQSEALAEKHGWEHVFGQHPQRDMIIYRLTAADPVERPAE